MRNWMCRWLVLALAGVLLLPAAVVAQESATLSGTVEDTSGGALPGVTVQVVENDTGRQNSAVTDASGTFRVPALPPGNYRVEATLSGFATMIVPEIELLVGQNADITIQMALAGVEETITVTAEAPLVDLVSSEVAGNVDRRMMDDLPVQGRNWMELALLVKGITANDTNNNRPGITRDESFQLNLDGQQITQQVASSGFGQPKFSREAIAEFQIVTNQFDVTQGRSSGGTGQRHHALGHQRRHRQPLRLLPRRPLERRGPHRRRGAAVRKPADRRGARRTHRRRQGPLLPVVRVRTATGQRLRPAGAPPEPGVGVRDAGNAEQLHRARRSHRFRQRSALLPGLLLGLRDRVQHDEHAATRPTRGRGRRSQRTCSRPGVICGARRSSPS